MVARRMDHAVGGRLDACQSVLVLSDWRPMDRRPNRTLGTARSSDCNGRGPQPGNFCRCRGRWPQLLSRSWSAACLGNAGGPHSSLLPLERRRARRRFRRRALVAPAAPAEFVEPGCCVPCVTCCPLAAPTPRPRSRSTATPMSRAADYRAGACARGCKCAASSTLRRRRAPEMKGAGEPRLGRVFTPSCRASLPTSRR